MSVDVAAYMRLFLHRSDVFSEQQPSGAYFPVRRPVTEDDLGEHFAGFATYGAYVIDPEANTVGWFCFDLDTQDPVQRQDLMAAVNSLVIELAERHDDPDITKCLLLEATHGAHDGYHIWCFFDAPVPAAKVRAWVSAGMTIPCEFFPKQDNVDAGGFGNLVRLPLGVHLKTGLFSEFISVPGWAGAVEDVVPLPASLVPQVEVPVKVAGGRGRSVAARTGCADKSTPSSPFACIDAIVNDGAPSGCRDKAMFHLALYYQGHGIPYDLAEELCHRANEVFDPPLREQEVRAKVDSAYSGRYASAKCGTDWLEDFCPGPCQTGWHVKQAAPNELYRAEPGDHVTVEVAARNFVEGLVRITVTHPDALNRPTFTSQKRES